MTQKTRSNLFLNSSLNSLILRSYSVHLCCLFSPRLTSAEAHHALRLRPNLTRREHAIWERAKTVHSSSGGRAIWFKGIRIARPEWATWRLRDLLDLSSLQQGSGQRRVPLTMYSPQSLHRWGITHSESMERLAYSQGRSGGVVWMNDSDPASHSACVTYKQHPNISLWVHVTALKLIRFCKSDWNKLANH